LHPPATSKERRKLLSSERHNNESIATILASMRDSTMLQVMNTLFTNTANMATRFAYYSAIGYAGYKILIVVENTAGTASDLYCQYSHDEIEYGPPTELAEDANWRDPRFHQVGGYPPPMR
jgi:hypothetical protein